MSEWLPDAAVARLRAVLEVPDLEGTRYRLLHRLGAGGMGAVYLAEDLTLERTVALKVLDVPEADGGGELSARLLREARVLARLEHPGVVPVHDAGALADGRVYYAMKFVEGERLDRWAPVPGIGERLRVFLRVAEAVAFAHARGVLHRDLKPANVMVGRFGEVLVLDWGLARALADPDAHGTVAGTPGWMAPEQERGDAAAVDARTDVWALGALLFFLLEAGGEPPPRALAAIAGKAMARDRERRYPGAPELARDVERWLEGEAVGAHKEGLLERAGRLLARHRVAVVLILTYLVVRAALLLAGRGR